MAVDRSYVRSNRRSWDRAAEAYEHRHARSLAGKRDLAWGLWRIPESTVGLLGRVRGRRVLELGCGAARWSAALARRGAVVTGLDVSAGRLAQADRVVRRAKTVVRLVQASAETLPFDDRSFDIVFCDWGGMTFADPRRTVPECARVLEEGGTLAFSTSSPLRYLTLDIRRDRQDRWIRRSYFDLERIVLDGTVEFSRTYGGWVELFRTHGFTVERLIETRPEGRRTSGYLSKHDNRWADSWPTEALWSVRKEGSTRAQPRVRKRRSPR